MLVIAVALEWRGLYPARLEGRRWGLGAGVLAGVIGGAVGTPGPPVVLYATTQGWSPRTIKANLQAFFVVNQVRSEEHTSELQSRLHLVCRLLLEKKKTEKRW